MLQKKAALIVMSIIAGLSLGASVAQACTPGKMMVLMLNLGVEVVPCGDGIIESAERNGKVAICGGWSLVKKSHWKMADDIKIYLKNKEGLNTRDKEIKGVVAFEVLCPGQDSAQVFLGKETDYAGFLVLVAPKK